MRNRRQLIALLGGAVASPVIAPAQEPAKIRRVGFLAGASRPSSLQSTVYDGFLRGMRELGYVDGKDFVVEWRFAEGRPELFPALAAELVRINVDVIVVATTAAVPAVQQASSTIPIVMGSAIDPVGRGLVASLAHPGGNITGLANSQEDTTPKRLELLMMAVPNLTRLGIVLNPQFPAQTTTLKVTQAAIDKMGRALVPAMARSPEEIASAFATLTNDGVDAIMITGDPFFFSQRQRIAELALRHRLPTIFPQREYVEAGGLMSYGENLADFFRRAAFYVDKIFKGAKPADLPIQQPTRFFLVINLKTAKALGIDLPATVLARADEVIE